MGELCLDFINSKWYATHKLNKEILRENDFLTDFFSKRNLHTDESPDSEIQDALLELRSFLEKTLEDFVASKSFSKDALSKIDEYLGAASCVRVVEKVGEKYRVALKPVLSDWNWIMAEIAASFVQLLWECDVDRIKICENPECRWVFYDETKSRTKRWCDDTCANRMKVRRFREKRKNI